MSKLSLPISILALVASIATFFYFQASQSEQVYVDVNQLLDGYKRTAIVKAEFQKKATKGITIFNPNNFHRISDINIIWYSSTS